MKVDRLLLLHGKPSKEKAAQPGFDPSRANFLGWLADRLAKRGGVDISNPVIPLAEDPSFEGYLAELRAFEAKGGREKGSLIVAHSAASGPVLEWASSEGGGFDGEILAVASWFDPYNRYSGMRFPRVERVQELGERLTVLSSGDDDAEGLESHEWLLRAVPDCLPVEVDGFGHFATGNNLKPDYDLGGGLTGSSCPIILTAIRNI